MHRRRMAAVGFIYLAMIGGCGRAHAPGRFMPITLVGSARVIDAEGQFVAPGFIDTHVHFIEGGFRLASVQLRDEFH